MNIQSLNEYRHIIASLKHKYDVISEDCFLYRGHCDHVKYILLPGVFRETIVEENTFIRTCNQNEKEIIDDYMKDSLTIYSSHNEKVELAQHYGVPTRLLDLTEDEYVALFFACCDEGDSFPSVWVINKSNYMEKFFSTEKTVKSGDHPSVIIDKILRDEVFERDFELHNDPNRYIVQPYIYQPRRIDQREINQKSHFMIWGADQKPINIILGSKDEDLISTDYDAVVSSRAIIGVITVDPDYRERILSELAEAGYDKGYIYPTADDHGPEVKKKNTNDNNTQYRKQKSGGVSIELKEAYPTKSNWKKQQGDEV